MADGSVKLSASKRDPQNTFQVRRDGITIGWVVMRGATGTWRYVCRQRGHSSNSGLTKEDAVNDLLQHMDREGETSA